MGRRRAPAGGTPPQLRAPRSSGMAARPSRWRPAGSSACGTPPPLPRELRRSGGVRRQSHPGRPLSRHELARGPRRRLEPPVARRARGGGPPARNHIRHDRDPLRPGHGGTREREVARTSRGPDRGRTCGVDTDVLRCRGRPSARRRLRPVGAGGSSARGDAAVARRGSGVRCPDPRSSGGHRRHRRGQGDPERRGPRSTGERPHVAGAHRRGQRLQLHPACRKNRRRRLG